MSSRKKRTLTRAEFRAMGATPGLMAHRVGPDGRARLEQLTAETRPRSPFGTGLTSSTIDRESEANEVKGEK